MAKSRSSIGNRPFSSLGNLIARKKIHLPEACLPALPDRPLTGDEERHLFREAMADVIPLAGRTKIAALQTRTPVHQQAFEDPDDEALQQLRRLVKTGHGFVLRHTAEYVEGSAEWVPPEVFRRIHRGYFSIQGDVDLHGMNLEAAQVHFDRFMRRAIASGMRAVLVVHGRGRCSPGPPVLKQNLFRWLVAGRWKHWVIAFTSARSCDGGTGATYVLLRNKPRAGKQAG